MLQQLKNLWRDTFHDSEEYVDMIFDHYYDPRLCLNYAESGRLISSSVMIPYTLADGRKIGYICGLATLPERRGEGIMRRLLEATEQTARDEGYAATILIPADDHLRAYYRCQGYRDADPAIFLKLNHSAQSAHISHISQSASVSNIIDRAMAWERLRGPQTLVHTTQQWRDIIEDIQRDGGSVLSLSDRAAVYRKADGEVGRLFGSDGDICAILRSLPLPCGEDRGGVYRCADRHEAEALRNAGLLTEEIITEPYGMIKPYIEGVNIRLMLD